MRFIIVWIYHLFDRIPPRYLFGNNLWKEPESARNERLKQEALLNIRQNIISERAKDI